MLVLLVEGREALTMSAVARRASCSKETLYKWFGDRDGLLTATVQWRHQKCGPATGTGRSSMPRRWRESPRRLLGELAQRDRQPHVDCAEPGGGESCRDGQEQSRRHRAANGRFAIGERLKPLLEAGREAGLSPSTIRKRPSHLFRPGRPGPAIRLLLGDRIDLTEAERRREAAQRHKTVLALYGARDDHPQS